ncbi:glycosyltransferase [bacterium]|nr:MAG: glycosyltransferase [bacterium]
MNIALIAPRFPPCYDGVGDHAEHLAAAFARAGHAVTVLTEGSPRPQNAYRVHSVGAAWNTQAIRESFRRITECAADLLVIEYTPFIFGASSMAPVVLPMMARVRGIHVAAVVHEAFHAERAGVRNVAKRRLLEMRDRLVLSGANTVCVAAEALRDRIADEVPAVASRVALVPIGANVEPLPQQRRRVRTGGRARLATFGVVMPRRRIDVQIRALAELVRGGTDAELHVLGRVFDTEYAEACRRLAIELGMSARVHLRGALPREQITAELLDADLALHTAEEGCIPSSGALLCLMAHGLPIVAAATPHDVAPLTEAVHSASPQALASAMASLLCGTLDGIALGSRAREIYESSFGWREVAARIVTHASLERSVRHAAGF